MVTMLLGLLLSAAVDSRPLGDPGTWIAPSDYPKSEMVRGSSGTTSFTLTVGKDGTVDDCSVTGSSGSDVLDATACALLKVRARFAPAHDAQGRKVSSSYSSRVAWVLPDDVAVAMPTTPQTLTVAVNISENGVIEDCSVTERPKGMSETAPTPCLAYPAGRKTRVLTGADRKPIKAQMIVSESVRYLQR